jgi:hypothetical protein
MVRTSDTKLIRPNVFIPDFSDLNRLYSTGVAMNDIDLALRKRELQDTISNLLFDNNPLEVPQLPDDVLMQTFTGKDFETSDYYALCKSLEYEIKHSQQHGE